MQIDLSGKNKDMILIGIPTFSGKIDYRLWATTLEQTFPCPVTFKFQPQTHTDFARNAIVDSAQKIKATHIWFLDDDMVLLPDMFRSMYEAGKDIVTAIAYGRMSPFNPCIYELQKDNKYASMIVSEKGLLEVDGCGMACCLIKTKVFDKLKKPYYYFGKNKHTGKRLGEDLNFCYDIKKEGVKIYADTHLKIGHLGEAGVITERTFLMNLPEDKRKKIFTKKPKIYVPK